MKDGIGNFHFQIEDTGIGLPSNAEVKLFSKFTQADSSITKKFGGTGLGLAITKELVLLMRGEIGAYNRKEKGSCFWFAIPFSFNADSNDQVVRLEEIKNVSILIVDDNEVNCTVLHGLLSAWGIPCHYVKSGKEALECLYRGVKSLNPYQIAIIDYQMPEMDGVTLARTIKNDPSISDTRLVML